MNDEATDQSPRGRWIYRSLWLCCAAGLAIDALLAWDRWQLIQGGQAELPGCASAGLHCSTVLLSPYGKVLGLALSTWAFAYYALFAALLLATRFLRVPWGGLLPPVFTSIGVVTAAWAMFVMALRLHEYCLWCLALHGVNLAAFLLAVVQAYHEFQIETVRRQAASLTRVALRPALIAVAAAVLLTAVQAVTLVHFNHQRRLEIVAIPGVSRPLELAGLNPASDDDAILTIKGHKDAPRRVVVFGCFTCPTCRKVAETLDNYVSRPGRELRIDVRFSPLPPQSHNVPEEEAAEDAMESPAGRLALVALAVAAVDDREFPGFSDWLYRNQHGMNPQSATAEAFRRVDPEAFMRSIDSDTVRRRLREDLALARRLKFVRVPRLVLPGGLVEGQYTAANLPDLLDAALFGDPR